MFLEAKLEKYKSLLFLIILVSFFISVFFLTRWSIPLLYGLSFNRIQLIVIAIVINLIIGLISFAESKTKKKNWLICLFRKEFCLALFSLLWFLIAKLTFTNQINIIGYFLSLSLAAFFLIISLSFLASYFNKVDDCLEKSKIPYYILLFLTLFFIAFYTWFSFLRFKAGLMGIYDLGNMEQAVWGTLNGHFLRNTVLPGITCRLGIHADIFLVLLAPFYALWSSPKLLLIIQTLIVGLGALPLYLITKKLLKSSLAGLIFAFAYLSSPILGAACLYEFHAVTLVTPFLLFGFYFLLEKRYMPYFIFIILALTCKEEVSLLIFLLGIYVYLKHNKKIGFITSLIGFSWFILVFFIVMPYFQRGSDYIFLDRYSHLGSNKSTIIKTLITRPDIVFKSLWNVKKITYFLYLILPLGGLMLFSAFTFLGLPSFAIYFLTNFEQMFSGGFHYSAPLLFYLLIGSIFGIKFWLKRLKARVYKPILLYSFTLFIFFSSFLFGCKFRFRSHGISTESINIKEVHSITSSEHVKQRKEIIKLIPNNASLSASVMIGVYFAGRKDLYIFPKIDDAEYVVLEQPGWTWTQISHEDYVKEMSKFRKNKNYQIIYENHHYLVAKRKI
jgi:uncharacterized membrane protein